MGKTMKSFIERTAGFFSFAGKLSRKEAGALLLTLAAALAVWLFAAENYRREAVKDISRSLETINSYKIKEISSWRGEHLREALRLSRHPFLGEIVSEEMAKPGSRRAQLTAWAKDHAEQKRYCSMAFLSPKGAVIAGTPGYLPGIEKQFAESFAQAQKGGALLTDLYLAADGRPRMTMFSPISPGGRGGRTLCMLVVNIDPEKEFYPLLKAAPLFFARAETQLVRKEGGKVLFLNEQDYSRDSALKLARPLADGQLPSAAALSGRTGFFEGVDYRGVKVFSAIGQVEGSGWAVITKIDRKMALAPVRDRQLLALTLILAAALLLYGAALLVLRRRVLAGLKQAEEALRESEERLRVTLEETQIGTWDWDVVNDIWHASPTYFTMLGYAPEPGNSDRKVWLSRAHPDDVAMVAGKIRGVLAGLDVKYQYEARLRHADGTYRWNAVLGKTIKKDSSGKPARIIGVRMDITARKLAEEKLEEAAKNWLDTFDAIDDIVWMMDAESRIIRVNKATEKTFHLTAGDLIGRHCWEVVHGSRQPIAECPALPAKKKMRRETAEYGLNGKIYEIIVDPIVGADGKYAGAVH
ncbi:MAG: PAS domain S-box protein, partial [Elusimicrobia bacterium]|nr:PAS domain S-box protein [Elusimicrobiota bacterium]